MALVDAQIGELPVKRFAEWEPEENLQYFITCNKGGFSSDPYGGFNLGLKTKEDAEIIAQNYRLLYHASGYHQNQLIIPLQCHTSNVACLDDEFLQADKTNQSRLLENTDAVITDKKDVLIGVLTADCVPLLLYAPDKEVVGVVHAGWRGTAQKIVVKTINRMVAEFGIQPKKLKVGVGPCISLQNYQVGSEVAAAFETIHPPKELPQILQKTADGFHLDLVQSNVRQMIGLGVLEKNVVLSEACTAASNEYYSYRKSNGDTGRFLTCIGLR